MAPNKNKTRRKAKLAKKAAHRASGAQTSRKPTKKKSVREMLVPSATQKKRASRPTIRTRKKKPVVSAEAELRREFQGRNLSAASRASARQSEDFEGVSRAEQADSESIDELVEEGNVFEAGAVAGVQEADDSDEREVRTHELPEDDVPEEYLDKD